MPTDMQERINLKLDQCVSIDDMRAKAQSFADEVGCSKTYVLRLVKKREGAATKPDFTVKPKEPTKPESIEGLGNLFAGESESPDFLEHVDDSDGLDLDESEFEDKIPEPKPTTPTTTLEEDLGEIVSVENVGTLVAIPFRLIALVTDYDGWMLTDSEKQRLSPMARKILLKHMPAIMTKYFAEVVFVILAFEVIGEKAKAWREWQHSQTSHSEEMEKKAQEDIEREKELATQQAQDQPRPPEPTDTQPKKPLTKEEAGTPKWMKEGKRVG